MTNGKNIQSGITPSSKVPKIENIHQKVFEAVTNKGSLEMGDWHTDKSVNESGEYCGTTHCRGGWVVALAGKQGRALEMFHDPLLAAHLIYKESSSIQVPMPRFFEGNEAAMADIKRCAEEEKKQQLS